MWWLWCFKSQCFVARFAWPTSERFPYTFWIWATSVYRYCASTWFQMFGTLLTSSGCDVSNRNALSRGLHGLSVSDFLTPFESEPHLSTGFYGYHGYDYTTIRFISPNLHMWLKFSRVKSDPCHSLCILSFWGILHVWLTSDIWAAVIFPVAMLCRELCMIGILLMPSGCDVSNRNALSRGLTNERFSYTFWIWATSVYGYHAPMWSLSCLAHFWYSAAVMIQIAMLCREVCMAYQWAMSSIL